MMTDLNNHFLKNGAYYPVGGSSEIAINIIPVIERAGTTAEFTTFLQSLA
jgi:hypothetical protein